MHNMQDKNTHIDRAPKEEECVTIEKFKLGKIFHVYHHQGYPYCHVIIDWSNNAVGIVLCVHAQLHCSEPSESRKQKRWL